MSIRKDNLQADNSQKTPGSDPGADSRLGALAGGIAHDLNTVITTIYGYSEMALESLAGSPEAAGNIRRIIGAADRASRSSKSEMIFCRLWGGVGDNIQST